MIQKHPLFFPFDGRAEESFIPLEQGFERGISLFDKEAEGMEQTIQSYLESVKGKRVAVLGIGVSNTPLIQMLVRADVKVTACDKRSREDFGGRIEALESLGVKVYLGEDYLEHLRGQDVIFRTPGMRPDLPQLVDAAEKGSVLTSEMEVFFRVCPCPIIAVTGSDGKTTTTTIIAELLKAAGKNVYLGGNIGKPLLPEVEMIEPTDVAVVELSSFQLMTMDRSPHIAVVTNIAPNHLDVHRSMGEYISAKENILLHQGPEDRVVLNADNQITRSFLATARGESILFSRREEPKGQAVFLREGAIWLRRDGEERQVLPVRDILLPGDHNVENYMAAIGAVDGLVPDEVIRTFAAQFSGVEHRIELVRELNGVRYYNDSIASSPTRTIAGLRSFDQKIIIIAGGYDKNIPYEPLAPEILEHVKVLVLMGATGTKIEKAVRECPGFAESGLVILHAKDMKEAVDEARAAAKPGDIVSLSPASASFDLYPNFEVRGRHFKELVNAL